VRGSVFQAIVFKEKYLLISRGPFQAHLRPTQRRGKVSPFAGALRAYGREGDR
jgi:hypothetical protein